MQRLLFTLLVLLPSLALADPVRVGVILPLSGDATFWGDNCRKGIELAQKELGDRAKRIELFFEDERCDPKQAVSAFQKLTDLHKASVILGPVCSSSSAAVAPLAERKSVTVAAYSEATSIPLGAHTLRLWAPNERQGRKLAESVYQRGHRRAAMIAAANAYGSDLTDAFRRRFVELGGELVAESSYVPDTSDVRPQLLVIQGKHPDVLVLGSYIKDGALVVNQARAAGMTLPIFGSSTMDSPEFISLTGANAEGIHVVDVPDNTTERFQSRWKETFGTPWPGLASGGSVFYEFTLMLVAALEKGIEPEMLKHYFITLNDENSPLRFDSDGNLRLEHQLLVVEKGKFKPA